MHAAGCVLALGWSFQPLKTPAWPRPLRCHAALSAGRQHHSWRPPWVSPGVYGAQQVERFTGPECTASDLASSTWTSANKAHLVGVGNEQGRHDVLPGTPAEGGLVHGKGLEEGGVGLLIRLGCDGDHLDPAVLIGLARRAMSARPFAGWPRRSSLIRGRTLAVFALEPKGLILPGQFQNLKDFLKRLTMTHIDIALPALPVALM